MRTRALLIAAALAVSSCSDSPKTASVEAATTERLPATTTSTTTPAPDTVAPGTTEPTVSLLPPARLDRNQPGGAERSWQGERFDFGIIAGIRQEGGVWLVDIDREQVPQAEGGYLAGPGLTIEPILVGDPPRPIRNDSTALRTFSVSTDADVLRLGPFWACGDGSPTWTAATVAELAAWGVGRDRQDALTFDNVGQVTRIRLSRGC